MLLTKYSHFLGAISSILIMALSISSATAQEPQFYPNAKYNSVTMGQLQSDLASCKSSAGQYLAGQDKPSVAGQGVRTAAKGAALGALAGSITGEPGRGAGAGAAVGGVAGTAKGLRTKGAGNPDYQKYVNLCLEEKGYKIISWK